MAYFLTRLAKNLLQELNLCRKKSVPRPLLAIGSLPVELKSMPFDQKRIISSTEALQLQEVPNHLVVVGGG
jgi:pyruvate/2-oxoglutarate dehydrogenase complex dihydrolipoamide dehydrogenase (E3) component